MRFSPLEFDLEDSGVTEFIGHPGLGQGAEGGAAHVKVRLRLTLRVGALVGDDDGHVFAGAFRVLFAPDL